MPEQSLTIDDITLPIKRTDGETLESRLTANAYHNILPARYLKTDSDGNIIEDQEDLFERVAKNVALAEAVFEAANLEHEVTVRPEQVKPDHPRREELIGDVFGDDVTLDDDIETSLTEANVNKFAYETVVPELPSDLQNHVEAVADEFQSLMERLGFIPNSPTLMNAGDELQQLSACFVDSPEDDIEDIHETAKEAAQIFQSGGGNGYAFSRLRPYGDSVGSSGGIASGPISFMRTFDQMCSTIAQGGARRGAQMGIMRVSHPDVIEFIHAKDKDVSLAHTLKLNDPDDYTHTSFQEALEEARELIDDDGRVPKHLRNAVEGHLSNFNISVGITDDFMTAVKRDEEFTFTNPRTGDAHIATGQTKELYEMFGLGEYVTVGETLTVPARIIWERIIEGAHGNGEPGVVFLERMNDHHSYDVDGYPEYRIRATNPCGEQELMEYEACNLGHINLSTLVARNAPDWRVWKESHTEMYESAEDAASAYLERALDTDELEDRIETGVRFLDNVVTMSDFPVEEMSKTVRNNRKIGLGIMGLAQMFIQLGVEYGSEDSQTITKVLMNRINTGSKLVSHDLAKERGVFKNWDESKYADPMAYPEWFETTTGLDPTGWEDGFKLRNHKTTTIAPTGTTSMVGNTTGGCEPIYNVAFYKNVSDDVQGDEMLVEFDDYFLRTLEANDIDVDAVKAEAEEQMANNEFSGVDSLSSVPSAIGELFVTTGDLTPKQHAGIQCAAQDGVDSSISKTVNAPNDSTVDDAKAVFEYIYDHGGKGVTYYRDGTRSKQVLTTRAKNKEFADEAEAAEALFDEIIENFGSLADFISQDEVPMATSDLQSSGESTNLLETPDKVHSVTRQIETGYGNLFVTIHLEDGEPIGIDTRIGESGGFTESFTESVANLTTLCLRAGIDTEAIIESLEGIRSPKVATDDGENIHSIPDAIASALRRDITSKEPVVPS